MNLNVGRQFTSYLLKKLFKPRKERKELAKGTKDEADSCWKQKNRPG